MAEESSAGKNSPAVCPGLDTDCVWDEGVQLRGELYTREHLDAHAKELARAHAEPVLARTAGPLRKRLARAKERIQEAYQILGQAAKHQREPSPAEEWLLDNANVVQDQLREIAEDLPHGYLLKLPRLRTGAMAGYPRVYGLCLDYLRHTDGRVDVDALVTFVRSYQSVQPLTIGELWAVPIMLRIGLILIVGALAASEATADDAIAADHWAAKLLRSQTDPTRAATCLHELERTRKRLSAAFLVQLQRRLREADTPLDVIRDWLIQRSQALGTTPDDLKRREHFRQAADQVSVGNAITSMRSVSAMDWEEFFERTSDVEAILTRDPVRAYEQCDKATRDRYRHAVEELARQSKVSETSVAEAVLACAESAKGTADRTAAAHVGYHLIDDGRPSLERSLSYKPKLRTRIVQAVLRHPNLFYFGLLVCLSLLFVAALFNVPEDPQIRLGRAGSVAWLLACALGLLPASEVAVGIVNALTVSLLPPRRLAKLEFSTGIPDEHRTLVVVPVLVDSIAAIDQVLEDLEVRSLANPDPNLNFAVLSDFPDAPSEEVERDQPLLERLRQGIVALNKKQGVAGEQRYWLLHRRRIYNPSEGCFMGWERKRGKLEELDRLLRGASDTSFCVVDADRSLFSSIRYVITLDADTDLPRDVAAKLVGCLAHPLNAPNFDPEQKRVTSGHAILQPRVGTLPKSSRRTRYSALLTGPSGIDPYTTAVSDTYQDLFGEGSFVGKGIHHVDAFNAALEGRIPENRVLSHDLFEGLYARSALVTDIEVLDEQPTTYAVQAARQHRWIRGDWQLLPWLFPTIPRAKGRSAGDLRAIDHWKIFDNLRRSLLAPAIVVESALSWFLGYEFATVVLALVAAVYVVPLVSRLLLSLLRESSSSSRPRVGPVGGDLESNSVQLAIALSFTLDQAWISIDAIARALYRMLFSHRHLLEWTTMRQSTRNQSLADVPFRMWVGSVGCLLAFASVVVFAPLQAFLTLPLLASWGAAPMLARWLSRPRKSLASSERLLPKDAELLGVLAQKTWRFFSEFVSAKDHNLPPDNYQEDPRGVVAHRTSPTNIGLYLLSVASARDLGFITLQEMHERLAGTLDTLEKLPKHEGHILNWYDTESLRPLEPQYVSTVDSGNLAAYLWTLNEACLDAIEQPLDIKRTLTAVRDALRLALSCLGNKRRGTGKRKQSSRAEGMALEVNRALVRHEIKAIEELVSTAERGKASEALLEVARSIDQLRPMLGNAEPEVDYWLVRACLLARGVQAELCSLQPWCETSEELRRLAAVPALRDPVRSLVALLSKTRSVAQLVSREQLLLERIKSISDSANSLAEHVAIEHELSAVDRAVRAGAAACRTLSANLQGLGARAVALADAMNFRFLFDERRELFTIGYNVSSARIDPSHYDLLASEARLASLFAIAKGDIPQSHWFRLGRPRAPGRSAAALLSWSGSMFEYLMPLLCTRNSQGTLLSEAYDAALERQREYAASRGVPWGVSESAYNVMDLRMTYQYRAFGVPGLGLKSGLGDDLVITPYATLLAGLVQPETIGKNIRALQREGLDGPYGLYEAIDYTREHVPPGRSGVVVKAFMAHHQGMSLVAIQNILLDGSMQRRFHRVARIKATELLLEERIPQTAPPARPVVATIATRRGVIKQVDSVEHAGLNATGPLRTQLLGHGELSALVSATGTGVTCFKGLDVGRFREDQALDAGGTYVYVRNRTRNRLWSAAYMPTRQEPAFYNVAFAIDRVEFHRKDGDIQTVMEISLSPEHAVEVRRITLSNQGKSLVDLEVTTYCEVVLAPRTADVAHRAFGNMFIEIEALPGRFALLARRKPRTATDSEVWMVQVLVAESGNFGPLDFECSRSRFVGRGRTPENAEAAVNGGALSRQTGRALDPIFALRRGVRLNAGATARVTLTTGLANSREEALALIETYSARHAITRAIELGWAGSRVELRHLGISATEVQRFQRLLSATLFPSPALRLGNTAPTATSRGLAALWAQGLSGDLPIVVCRIDRGESSELCRELLLAHEYWRLNGFASDLVFINEEPGGYLQTTLDNVRDLSRNASLDQRGGVFVRRAEQMSEEERELLLLAARVVLHVKEGSLARQLRRVHEVGTALHARALAQGTTARAPARREGTSTPSTTGSSSELGPRPSLLFDNGLGGFGDNGREYVISLSSTRRTPAPWCNVIANPNFGTLVSETGGSFTWSGNSQRHRLSPWRNDALSDPSGELVYVRDDQTSELWSPTPAPAGGNAHYLVSHGRGYSRFEHERDGLWQQLTQFISRNEPIKFFRLQLENRGSTPKKLSLFCVVEWVLGQSREQTRAYISTNFDASSEVLCAFNPLGAFPTRRAFLASSLPVKSMTADRLEVFGSAGTRSAPQGLRGPQLSGAVGAGYDPAGALHVQIEIAPGERCVQTFVVGEADNTEAALALCSKYRDPAVVDAALGEAQWQWRRRLGQVQIRTPDAALDVLHNHWLLYQSLSSRIWGRTGFYQSSGAYGFRDQLQDVLALLHTEPELAREHLLRCAAHQFVEGDVQHWWHEETGQGLRTRCSDDMLWLPYATAAYVRSTGDVAVLDECVPFLVERELSRMEEDLFSAPPQSEQRASLYEHCVRALEVGMTSGPHHLPTMRGGDWNDGMNRVGHEGEGESVWLAWFLARTLLDFSELVRQRGEFSRQLYYEERLRGLAEAIEESAWDGQWYRRAFFDNGSPLGSRQNKECTIDAIAQSWAAIAGVGDPERAAQAVASSEARLISPEWRLMKLLAPPFEQTQPDPGYIQAYPAGIRENGGQYTHGVLWTVLALTRLKEGDRAHALLDLLNPIRHGDTPEAVARYVVEPYVVAADVYAGSGHEGRGGWTWYTGSAGWMYRIVLENMLGLTRRGPVLNIQPCIPRDWPGFEVDYRFGAALYHLRVSNPHRICSGVQSIDLDGSALDGTGVPLTDDGQEHELRVIMGSPEAARRALARSGTGE